LLDNYKLQTREQEQLTQNELNEESNFLHACLETELMEETLKFLIEEDKVKDKTELKNLLSDIWFTFYSRTADST
jgi:hypothetical protein